MIFLPAWIGNSLCPCPSHQLSQCQFVLASRFDDGGLSGGILLTIAWCVSCPCSHGIAKTTKMLCLRLVFAGQQLEQVGCRLHWAFCRPRFALPEELDTCQHARPAKSQAQNTPMPSHAGANAGPRAAVQVHQTLPLGAPTARTRQSQHLDRGKDWVSFR